MHIHGANLNIQGANLASNASGGQSAAAQRAAEVRKRLLKNAQSIDGDASPEETLLGQWMNSQSSHSLSEDQYHGAGSGKDPDFG